MTAIPLVERAPQEAFARVGDRDISVAAFCADIEHIAAQLPETQFVINLCEDRYFFTAGFFAALARGQTNLLPSRRELQFVRELANDFAPCAIISDSPTAGIDACIELQPGANGKAASPMCDAEHRAAIAFTSGSTGEPQAHSKSWRMLDTWRKVHQRYLPGSSSAARGLVATVPSWHMYGLEWAMLLPTVAPLTLHCGADFYPQDVSAALSGFAQPSVLVSTPVHLRALTKQPRLPGNVSLVLSATAPLDDALTRKVEKGFGAQLFEIYGCSEVGSLASRFPGRSTLWTFFDCFSINFQDGAITVDHPELTENVILADRFKRHPQDQYELEGRNSDIVKIAGKRESLANLNGVLLGALLFGALWVSLYRGAIGNCASLAKKSLFIQKRKK